MINSPKWLLRTDAANYVTARGLPLSPKTLQKWATTGGGPVFRKFGSRVVYTPEDLDAWISNRLSSPRASTSAE